MPSEAPRIYWDADVFLSYIDGVADRLSTLGGLLDRAAQAEIEIVTSALTITEVAFAEAERLGTTLDPQIEADIDVLWLPPSRIRIVELSRPIAVGARELVRLAMSRGWRLKPPDAIHLATAQRTGAATLHTYDSGLQRWHNQIGLAVLPPSVERPRMPGL